MYSNYSEENYCGSLKEEKIDSKFMTELGETETKIIIKSVALYISLKDSNEKMNIQTTNVVKDMNGIKSIDRKVDYSEYKPIGSMALLKFDAATISPDVDGKMKSESKEVMKIKNVVPWEIKAHGKFGNAIELDLLGERPNRCISL